MKIVKKFFTLVSLFVLGTSILVEALTLDYKFSGLPFRSSQEAKQICPGLCKKFDMEWTGKSTSQGLCLCQKNP